MSVLVGFVDEDDDSPSSPSDDVEFDVLPDDEERDGDFVKRRPTLPKWLRDRYGDTLATLRDEMESDKKGKARAVQPASNRPHAGLPKCYKEHSFWIKYGQSEVFKLWDTDRQLLPTMFFPLEFFVWFPHLLCTAPLRCPACHAAGRTGKLGKVNNLRVHSYPCSPRRVIDIDKNIYIIGVRYYCGDSCCKASYQSWSPAILGLLPPPVANSFPFCLTYRCGVTDTVLALIRSCFQRSIGPSAFARMLRTFHTRKYEQMHLQYLLHVQNLPEDTFFFKYALHEGFGAWDDLNGYAGYIPSHHYFRGVYSALIELHAAEMDQRMAMLSGRSLALDHSFKVKITLRYTVYGSLTSSGR